MIDSYEFREIIIDKYRYINDVIVFPEKVMAAGRKRRGREYAWKI